MSLENKFSIDNLKEEMKLNNFYNENNIGLFIYPNICLKNMYTINMANKLSNNEKKILVNLMNDELNKINISYKKDYNKFLK